MSNPTSPILSILEEENNKPISPYEVFYHPFNNGTYNARGWWVGAPNLWIDGYNFERAKKTFK